MVSAVKTAVRIAVMIMPCLGAVSSAAEAAAFKVDPSRSSLVVEICREGAASRFAHDHVVQATSFSGRIVYDPAAPGTSSISIEVNTATLRADSPQTRQRFQVRGEPTPADVSDIERNMKAEGQLHVAKFPLITFVSTTVTAERQGQYWVTGQLTIHGVTRTVRFPATVVMEGQTLRGTGTLSFTQSSFGYRPYSALLGAIKNKDAATLHIDLVAIPE